MAFFAVHLLVTDSSCDLKDTKSRSRKSPSGVLILSRTSEKVLFL